VKFAQAVYAGLSQRDAAVRAGCKPGRGLDAQASKLARDAVVVAELARLHGQAAEKAAADRAELVGKLTEHFRADIGDFVKVVNGVPTLDFARLRKKKKTHLIESIEVTDKGSVKFKMHSVHGAADRLAKLLGLNAPEKNINMNVGNDAKGMSEAELLAEAKRLGIADN
jgi:hypothetical protein